MKMIFIFIIILNLIIITFCPIPTWDFSKNSFELTNLEFEVCSKTTYDITAKIIKKIYKNTNPVSFKNYVKINEVEKEVGFEDIDSVYKDQLNIGYLVCPRSKYHPFKFNEGTYMTLSPNFNNGDDFQLKCYKHDTGYFIIAYLSNGQYNFFVTKDSVANWDSNSIKLYNGVYDFALTNGNNGNNGEYAMVYLTLEGGYLKVKGAKLILKQDKTDRTDCSSKDLFQAKTHSKGYFNENGAFYYITYDETSFNSGYSTTGVSSSNSDSANYAVVENKLNNPFDFTDEVEIEEMNFIENTVYVYYILINKRTGKKNYGLINMIYNQIIYNTDEEIISFVPYTSNQMLAITSTSAYKVCAFLNRNGDNCIEYCDNDNVLDTDGNKCASECGGSKILLYPQNICTTSCDTNFYVRNDNKCGLCKDLNSSNPFKLINTPGCVDNFDENIYEYYNEEKKLLQCKSEYKLENDQCVPINVEEAKVTTEEIIIPPSTQIHEEPTEAPTIEPEHIEPEPIEPEPIEPEPIETNCKNKRCSTCNSLSDSLELCLSCDESKYKKVNYIACFIYKYQNK